MTFRPEQIGDKGQRYEVRYAEEGFPQPKTLGWASTLSGAEELAAAWRLRPYTTAAWVVDRCNDRIELESGDE